MRGVLGLRALGQDGLPVAPGFTEVTRPPDRH